MFQHQCDRLLKIRQTLFPCPPLPVHPRHLGAIGDEPRTVLLDNCCELVAHQLYLSAWLDGPSLAGEIPRIWTKE